MLIPLLLTLLVVVLLLFLAMIPDFSRREELAVIRTNYAHRGLHGDGRPENSRAAFAAAIAAGYGIELDIRLSADGVPVVFHDDTLDRVCGRPGRVSALTFDELRQVSLGACGETVPSFAEVLELVAGQVPLLIEIKGEDSNTAICAAAAELLDNYDGLFSVQSFNPLYLRWFNRNRPAYFRGLLYSNLFKEKNSQSFLNRCVLSAMLLNFLACPDFVAYCHTRPHELPLWICRDLFRIPCLCWTVRSEAEASRCVPEVSIIFEGFTPDR